ncbi:hydroxymethylglutaryl-CoA lyase [Microthyrium microscopicum]|uniref:hydroxymethylglutaryl-CoA lyase n=1 Tax=Microthyrium microscopicum TaxID=703497 RepID=A0A6A6U8A4_9PEZI|nr:hydroxymethylglutaryl-CoA lyase [Microthyrium microscopicum]
MSLPKTVPRIARTARFARFHAGRQDTSCRRFATAVGDHVSIVEVGPRDGLQNEKNTISLETKTSLIERLAKTGLSTIEAGAFVSPKWIPQMANSDQVLQHLLEPHDLPKHIKYQFLVPNSKGLESFLALYEKQAPKDHEPMEVSIFTAATESFAQKNTNCSIAESLTRFEPVFSTAKAHNIRVRAYISVALGCPYEGPDVDPKVVADLAVDLLQLGAEQISIGDTTGMGTAPKTRILLKTLAAAGVEMQDVALHLHDTYGQALVNAVVGAEAGVRVFDASVAGLGGCPYSPGATGNVPTEDMVYLFETLGLSTGVDLPALAEVGEWISRETGRSNESRVGKGTLARARRKQN